MKLPNELLEESELRQLKIRCFKMLNGLLAFTYVALTVWAIVGAIRIITG